MKKKLSLENLRFPDYQTIKRKIEKKLGLRPKMPGDLPAGIWTEQALKVLTERYLLKNDSLEPVETPEEMCWRVAWEVASAEVCWGKGKNQVLETAKSFYRLLVSRQFFPNSPTLMNAGTDNGLQYSACFVIPIEDSMEGIFDALKYQALIHKTGGGTGFSFSRLRPQGSMVKTSKGTASGPVSFMRIFDAATNEVKQGGKRRGANMGILRVDHPDILEFIHCKSEGGITNFNISVGITDEFMEAFKNDEEYSLVNPKTKQADGSLSAKKVLTEIARAAWETGDPGVVFLDRINTGSSNPVPSLGPIESTNPCVTGDTLISTDKGLIRIEDLYQQKNNLKLLADSRLSDIKFQAPTRVIKTGKKQIYRLITKEGYELKLTGDHKVLTENGWIKALNLKRDDKIFLVSRKGGFGFNGSLDEGQIMGWLVGDGTIKATSAVLSFFGYEKKELAPKFAQMVSHLVDGMQVLDRAYSVSVIDVGGRDEARVQSVRLNRYLRENGLKRGLKLIVPQRVFTGTEDMQRGFLQALFTADGHVEGTAKKGVSVRLTSVSESLLKDVQRLLLNFGIGSKIYTERRKKQKRLLPDGHNGCKEYFCSSYHDLVISKSSLALFATEIKFLSEIKNAKLNLLLGEYKEGPYRQSFYARFRKLVKEGVEMVYDLTEPMTSSFIANGLVVHNCGEQPLYPFDSCNLGSIFLTYFTKEINGKKEVDWEKLKEVTRQAIRFLDNVIEVNPYTLPQIRQTTLAVRRVGLGVGGWADMLIDLGIPYDSQEALDLAEKVMAAIYKTAVAESEKLAKERGPFPLWPVSIYAKTKPRRNSTVTTIAPTGTISIIAGASSGIEPLFAVVFRHIVSDKHLDRKMFFFNAKFEEIAAAGGFWSEEVKGQVEKSGVVRGIKEIPAPIRQIFGTAHEISPQWHVKMQAVFQKYTQNAVSKTINLTQEATPNDVLEAYLLAWGSGCKGITVFRDGSKETQVLTAGTQKEKTTNGEVKLPIGKRPFKMSGATYKLLTPVGSAFVTINQDELGNPLEVFINVGKAGSDVAAMAEALGRTISATLRFESGLSPKERAKEIAHQLSGIGGRRSVGFGPNKILSLPDAVSIALSYQYGFQINGNLKVGTALFANGTPLNGTGSAVMAKENRDSGTHDLIAETVSFIEAPSPGDICPSCGVSALVYQEGCSKCHACGHSEC